MRTNHPSHRLARMFAPRSIALVGASEKSIWTQLILRNYRDLSFDGKLFAVNRGGVAVGGVRGFTACTEIGEPVDVAFIVVPQANVLDAIEDAAAAGISNVAVLSSGYAEVGGSGEAAQRQLVARAEALGVNLWGPNSLGFNNLSTRSGVSVIPINQPILPPRIAIVSQSGSTAAELDEFAHGQNIGTSFVAATGNEGNVTLCDVIDYLIDDEPTRAIAVFAEAIRDPLTFEAAATRARKAHKPIVILKVGRSALASAVAQAHTGSLAGDDEVFSGVCERLGVVRVDTPDQLVTVAGLLAETGALSAPGLGFISMSGGACTLAADGAEARGVLMPPNDPVTTAALRAVLPDFASTLNPLDVTGAAMRDPDLFERVIPIAAAPDEIGLVAINMVIPTAEGQGLAAAFGAIGRATAALDKPAILATSCGKQLNDYTRALVADCDLPPIVTGMDAMLYAVSKAVWWSGQLGKTPGPLLITQPEDVPGARLHGERALLDHLGTAGVPVIPGRIARDAAEAAAFAATLDGPLVLKIASPDIAHKTEVGGVRLNVASGDAATTFDAVVADVRRHRSQAKIDGVIVSPMRNGGVELLVGVTRDPTWGLTLTLAVGGVLVELLADAATAPLPVTAEQVAAMLARLRGAKLLQGFRGAEAVDMAAVTRAIVAICDAAIAFGPALQALEINPLLVRGDRVEALDALAVWEGEGA